MAELRLFGDYMEDHRERMRRVVEVMDRLGVRYAVIGGHAVSYHWKPRLTVDVDFIVGEKALSKLLRELPRAGFVVERRGEIVRLWDAGADPAVDDPVVDLLPAEYNRTQLEALKSAEPVRYQGMELRIVTREALVALKYLSATSPHREEGDKHQDVADLIHVVKQSFSDGQARAARHLVELTYPGIGADFDRLLDNIRGGRPIAI